MSTRAGKPRYQVIADTLRAELARGDYPVGATFPKEIDLCARFDVSRFTIRNAVRELETAGLVERHKARGTQVLNLTPPSTYVQTLTNLDELLQYPKETRLSVRYAHLVTATETLAAQFGLADGEMLFNIGAIRFGAGDNERLCWTDVFVRAEHGGVADDIGRDSRPVYRVLEDRFGLTADDVRVDIEANTLTAEIAKELEVERGSPALCVTRRYAGDDGRVFEISISRHPSSRYTYSMAFGRKTQGERESAGTVSTP